MADNEFQPQDFEYDYRPSDVVAPDNRVERIAVIRTSDRIAFRRCRRRWHWSSHLRSNLGPIRTPAPLWVGVGFHFALEDFHAYKLYPSCRAAFSAYAKATYDRARHKLPGDWREQGELAVQMLDYYEYKFLKESGRDPLRTFVFNGVPQVEVTFNIDIPLDVTKWGYDRAVYSGTIDRVIIDDQGQLWIVEYKTAKLIQTMHFSNDSQVSTYCWAGEYLYGVPIAGVIYQQHRKTVPEPPPIVAGRISTAKNTRITRVLYREALVKLYGDDIQKWPLANVEYLNHLATMEDTTKDPFVRRDHIFRNPFQTRSEGTKILMEVPEMLNPNTPLYPNPTRDCSYLCNFSDVCVSVDDGSDWKYEMSLLHAERDREYDIWRKFLPVQHNYAVLAAEANEPPPQLTQI